jgi:hypothetical protein
MPTIIARRFRLSFALIVTFAAIAGAQQRPTGPRIDPPGPRVIVGVVIDTAGYRVDSAEVLIRSVERRAMTNAEGMFRFDDLKPGMYDLTVRKIGFFPQVRRIRLAENGGVAHFEVVRRVFALPPAVTVATQLGLSGVVGDTAYNIVSGAVISTIASDHRTVSDSTGAFYLDLKPGRYIVRVERAGFAPQLASVTLPSDSGRKIVVWMTPSTTFSQARAAWAFDAMQDRILRMNPVWSKILTREDILHAGFDNIKQLATMATGQRMEDECLATIDGGPARVPIWSLDPNDVEMMEAYTTPPPKPTNARIVQGVFGTRPDTRGQFKNPTDCGASLFIWLRK